MVKDYITAAEKIWNFTISPTIHLLMATVDPTMEQIVLLAESL
jgi:hypothetical protein